MHIAALKVQFFPKNTIVFYGKKISVKIGHINVPSKFLAPNTKSLATPGLDEVKRLKIFKN